MLSLENTRLAIVGLGYVGLPLAVAFGKEFSTVGFDINIRRITELNDGFDATNEVTRDDLADASRLKFSADEEALKDANVYIVTVPTPIDDSKRPDLSPLRLASETVARALKPGDVVIYESTVYPGVTEEYCMPIIEEKSGLKFNVDFFAGYSPERINPGDRERNVTTIAKITSGSTDEVADYVADLYGRIVRAPIHRAPCIKVAEAAKIIENAQRDINIALMNECAMIFRRIGIDTEEVLKAASTKWNFLSFSPGLVGGHCIGVDPYYLTHKAEATGYHPQVILAGRRTNDGMGVYVASQLIRQMALKEIQLKHASVLIMGLTFKENCSDTRNTRVVDIVKELRESGMLVDVYDPLANREAARSDYGIELTEELEPGKYHAIVLAVAHRKFKEMGVDRIRRLGKSNHVLYDLKYILPKTEVDLRL